MILTLLRVATRRFHLAVTRDSARPRMTGMMLKATVAKLFMAAGVLRFLRWRNRNRIVILYLHSVVDPRKLTWQPLRAPFSIDLLRKQLEVISRYYHWLTLDDAVQMLTGKKPVKPHGAVLTFDDGYKNNMSVCLPVLKEFSIKPVFYVATGLLNNRQPYWFERLDYVLQHIREPTGIRLNNRTFRFDPADRDSMKANYSELRAAAKRVFSDERDFYRFFDEVSSRLERECGRSLATIQAGDPCSETLSDEDLQHLSNSGEATIGSHTVDHYRLDTVEDSVCRRQLIESKSYLERLTGETCRHFCYPNGNLNAAVAEAVSAVGFESAVTTAGGLNSVGDDVFALKRLHLPNSTDRARILFLLSGIGQLFSRLRSFLFPQSEYDL